MRARLMKSNETRASMWQDALQEDPLELATAFEYRGEQELTNGANKPSAAEV